MAIAKAALLRGVELGARQSLEQGRQRQQMIAPWRGGEAVQRHGVLDAERPRGGAPQGGQMRAGAQRLADVLGECADIGSLAATHA